MAMCNAVTMLAPVHPRVRIICRLLTNIGHTGRVVIAAHLTSELFARIISASRFITGILVR